MATWFKITFTGEPTEADFARVAELAAEGFTSGQLLNEPGAEDEEGPATGWYAPDDTPPQRPCWPNVHAIDNRNQTWCGGTPVPPSHFTEGN